MKKNPIIYFSVTFSVGQEVNFLITDRIEIRPNGKILLAHGKSPKLVDPDSILSIRVVTLRGEKP